MLANKTFKQTPNRAPNSRLYTNPRLPPNPLDSFPRLEATTAPSRQVEWNSKDNNMHTYKTRTQPGSYLHFRDLRMTFDGVQDKNGPGRF